MGYEKFVKKIFPFIGNQYSNATEETSGYKKIDLIVGEIIADDMMCYINFDSGKAVLIPKDDATEALNHLIIYAVESEAEEGEAGIESVGLAYLTLNGQELNIWYSNQNQLEGNNLPWNCDVLGSGGKIRTDVITADMLGVKDAMVKFNPDFDVNHPEKWTEDLRIATIYYK